MQELVTDQALLTLSAETQAMIDELARLDNVSPGEVVALAIRQRWDRRLMEAHNAAYAALQQDAEAWREELAERAAWETTLPDGLPDA